MEWAGIAAIWLIALIFLVMFFKTKFIAASDYKSAIPVAKRLSARGFVPVINLLGEHYADKRKIEETVVQYFFLVDAIRECGLNAKISIKPTQVGLMVSKDLYFYNISRIARRAHNQKVPLEIDMEGLRYLDDTLEIFYKIPGECDVRQAIQAYLGRSKSDVGEMIGRYKKVRLVKGAYAESDLSKSEASAQMENLAEQLLICGNEPAIATASDENLIGSIIAAYCSNEIKKHGFIIQMLYGRRDKLKELLRDCGFRVEVYMPVGSWNKALPYIWRRIKEVSKSLS
jgi:proline dehydrogenase